MYIKKISFNLYKLKEVFYFDKNINKNYIYKSIRFL